MCAVKTDAESGGGCCLLLNRARSAQQAVCTPHNDTRSSCKKKKPRVRSVASGSTRIPFCATAALGAKALQQPADMLTMARCLHVAKLPTRHGQLRITKHTSFNMHNLFCVRVFISSVSLRLLCHGGVSTDVVVTDR
ncbi:hypothetical protein F2P81_002674 [Scophthalmus maximus]|uniref:Uncharacterized protein n=1 Tax=Scophthalmus maximus TaxID=52904 RepID=A0A6A4TLK4_SCOMX|nr:hypothetical protein F2P81_002674 [Scophthalmus maximus]